MGPPKSFTDLMENLGESDIARNFALQSGVAPDFRSTVMRKGLQARAPFMIQQLLSQPIPSGGTLQDVITTRGFQDYLSGMGGGGQMPDLGGMLRGAGAFLRSPQKGNARQEALNEILLGPEGAVGSERFAPLIGMASQGRIGRPMMNIEGAVQRSLQNMMAAEPMRFGGGASDFIDFLTQQGLI